MSASPPTDAGQAVTRPLIPFLRAGVLAPLDVHFARTLGRLVGTTNPHELLGAAMASRAAAHGHVCADLSTLAQAVRLEGASDDDGPLPWPDPEAWIQALSASAMVATDPATGEAPTRPLVLDGERLYTARYWSYQSRLVAQLRARAGRPIEGVDLPTLADGLARLFPGAGADTDRQAMAAAMATLQTLCVITGGPGTGKTTTVRKILALILEQAHLAATRGEGAFPPRFLLLAPTGKASARMREAICEGIDGLDVDDDTIRPAIPREATTLHRALGFRPQTPTRFRYGRSRPLPVDVVVVDEASMVDLAMMTKLLEALPPQARLILLGDRDQLSSVEAGAVLGDICRGAGRGLSRGLADQMTAAGIKTPPVADEGATPSPLVDAMVHLDHTYRFGPQSGIGALARAINAGEPHRAVAFLEGRETEEPTLTRYEDITLTSPEDVTAGAIRTMLEGPIRRLVVEGYGPAVDAATQGDGEAALAALGRFRILCAHRRGVLGVTGMGHAAERWLTEEGRIDPRLPWYPGRPILVTRNDRQLGLVNGDVGIIVATPDAQAMACFRDDEGGARMLHPSRLPPHETVFAMTIHKSQGSQMDHVAVVLPATPSRILTRELLYTAVTRASGRVSVIATDDVLRVAILERVQRASGLQRLLWEEPDASP